MLTGQEKLNVDIIREELEPIFQKHNVKKAILFGSVAKNKNSVSSDVDILVDSGLKGFKFLGLVEDIRQTLNKEVDIIDVKHINSDSRIEKEINQTGVLIYD